MSKKLYIETVTNSGSVKTYNIADPQSSLSLSTVRTQFGICISKDLFLVNGVKPTSVKSVYYQEIIRTDLIDD